MHERKQPETLQEIQNEGKLAAAMLKADGFKISISAPLTR